MAILSVVVVAGLIAPAVGLLLALIVFVPYVAVSAEHPAARARIRLPARWLEWLARALAEEEAELRWPFDRSEGTVGTPWLRSRL